MQRQKYCLDANVLIEAWQKYYSPHICPGYWELMNDLGRQGLIFIPREVYNEIVNTEDDLSDWLKNSSIPIHAADASVAMCLKKMYAADPAHANLVDSTKGRSLADPWVIAHAMKNNACVVTKENKVTTPNTTKVKIPNVCDNLSVRWINDFEFVRELGIKFTCSI